MVLLGWNLYAVTWEFIATMLFYNMAESILVCICETCFVCDNLPGHKNNINLQY